MHLDKIRCIMRSMSEPRPVPTPWFRSHIFAKVAGGFLLSVTGVVATWGGIYDWRFPWAADDASPVAVSGEMLAADSPVKVRWMGGDAIEATWGPMDYPDLNHYSVDVLGVFPQETSYNQGYRIGTELSTRVETQPFSRTNQELSDQGSATRVTEGQTWQICVTGMREAPGGVDITPYIIERSRRCSDIFSLPAGTED